MTREWHKMLSATHSNRRPFRTGRTATIRIRTGPTARLVGRDHNRDLIRRGAELSRGTDRCNHVIVGHTVLNNIVDAPGDGDGDGIDLLALTARGILFGRVLCLAAIKAVTDCVVLGTNRRSAGMPREHDPMVAS